MHAFIISINIYFVNFQKLYFCFLLFQREVKVVKKELKTEEQNRDQNGDTEAVMTVKLPTKKVGAKTETKVEVLKKILPDGTVQEVKTTTTKTTIDGKTEIKTETETRILSKEEADEEIEEVEEEEEEEEENGEISVQEIQEKIESEIKSQEAKSSTPKENGDSDNIIKTEERSETTTTTTKKIIIEQDKDELVNDEEEAVEEEEVEEAEPVTVVIKKPVEKLPEPEIEGEKVEETSNNEAIEDKVDETEAEENNIKEQVEENINEKITETENNELPKEESEAEDEETGEEEVEQNEAIDVKKEREPMPDYEIENKEPENEIGNLSNNKQNETKISVAEEKEEVKQKIVTKEEIVRKVSTEENKEEIKIEKKQEPQEELVKHEIKHEIKLEYEEPTKENIPQTEIKIPLREPSIPLEKVEDIEIKPIGPAETVTKSRIENTEIITTSGAEKPTGLCTEYNRIENIVTVNRTTKTLDQAYENISQQSIPTMKTYFAPTIDRITTSPLPSSPYQPVYPPVPTTERRHSLLLERLSVERQIPTDVYQYNTTTNNQTYEQQQRQWSQEPQAEVLTVSNVKPSSINQNNQQWYQQSTRDNSVHNNVSPLPTASAPAPPTWSQPKPQTQPTYKPQPTYSPQPLYQMPTYQSPSQPQYKPTETETIHERSTNTYSTYTLKPSWASTVEPMPTINTPSNQYSYVTKDKTESFKETTEYSSSYVPPPWEQDSSYAANNTQSYYQPPATNIFKPTPTPPSSQTWKPKPTSKFSKPPPTAYIPPAPNQSFVKPVIVEPPRLPGRKTYYSEYERRYITVPESNYIPTESKYQPQPDPSPQYYYDNNEPSETVEHEWRKELREFTEKSSQVQTETNIKPPWEVDQTYAKAPATTYTPTPTWSQTVRPGSWRERSFESEYVSHEWPKSNTLGRGRPLSTYNKPESTIPERPRGVSVDRYNPNSYQSPLVAEHPPVQTHTLTTPTPHGYHNPNVPAYHARASAETR